MTNQTKPVSGKLKWIVLAFSFVLIGLDQLFKWLAQEYLAKLPELTLPVISDIFHLTYLENRGAAFGIFNGKAFFLIGLTGAILLGLLILLLSGRIKKPFLVWTGGLILAGGVGNLIDRIFRGYVIDYLDFRVIQFAVFNLADCCVVVGTILVLVYLLFFDQKKTDDGKTGEIADSQENRNV